MNPFALAEGVPKVPLTEMFPVAGSIVANTPRETQVGVPPNEYCLKQLIWKNGLATGPEMVEIIGELLGFKE